MTPLRSQLLSKTSTGLLAEIVFLIDWPAAVVFDGDEVHVRNDLWMDLTGTTESESPVTLEHELRDFTHIEDLFEALKRGKRDAGVVHVSRKPPRSGHGEPPQHLEVRWRRLATGPDTPSIVLLVMKAGHAHENPTRVMAAQRKQINQLLVRQTLIEESERRRLGQALHDVVAQDLAKVRSMIAAKDFSEKVTASLVERIDSVIHSVRTLEFEVSPPILTDLGLYPALEWLAEHMGREYDASVTLVKGFREPRLSIESRTIVFRAVRELVLNAIKHAKGTSVEILCDGDDQTTRIAVSDTGPGFDTRLGDSGTRFTTTYGLLSVEQQIRGIGGLFSLVSSVKDGTLAIITIDAEPEKVD